MMRTLNKVVVAAIVCVAVSGCAQSAKAEIEKVAVPPVLKPLAMSVHGRVAVAGGDYVSQWPGVSYETRFQGTALYFTVGKAREILHLVVDGGAPMVLADPQPGVYRAGGLASSAHTATLYIATESADAPNHFGGFGVSADGKALAKAAKRARQMEFIGDSYTVGYGNTSPQHDCSKTSVYPWTDDTQAFGALTARHFDADYQVNAISGRGVVRNYNGIAADTLPMAYPFVLLDKAQRYNDPEWKPQWIVVSLGTNDFSTALHPEEKWKTRDELHADYEASYVRFLKELRAKNPGAFLIVWATDGAKGEIASEGKKVVDRMRAEGEAKIAFMPFNNLAFSGCDSHPSVEDDKTISGRLVEFIDGHPEVWKER